MPAKVHSYERFPHLVPKTTPRAIGREVGRATTDTFGEFVIDELEPKSRGYHLKAAGLEGRCSTHFDLAEESRYLGVMTLTAG